MIVRRLSLRIQAFTETHIFHGVQSEIAHLARARLGYSFGVGKKPKSQKVDSVYTDLETILAGGQQHSTHQSPKATKPGSQEQPQAPPRATKVHNNLDPFKKYHSTIAKLSNPDQIYGYLSTNNDLTSSHLVTAVERIVKLRKLAVFQIRLLGKSGSGQTPSTEGSTSASPSAVPSASSPDHPNPWKDPRFLFVLESISKDLDSLRPTDFIRLMTVLTNAHFVRSLKVVTSLLIDICQYVGFYLHRFQKNKAS